jgi:hypothetical protein
VSYFAIILLVKRYFYINLTFEVIVQAQKQIFNLNKMYENNLQKVVIFIPNTTF